MAGYWRGDFRLAIEPHIQDEQCVFCPGCGNLDLLNAFSSVLEGSWKFGSLNYKLLMYFFLLISVVFLLLALLFSLKVCRQGQTFLLICRNLVTLFQVNQWPDSKICCTLFFCLIPLKTTHIFLQVSPQKLRNLPLFAGRWVISLSVIPRGQILPNPTASAPPPLYSKGLTFLNNTWV